MIKSHICTYFVINEFNPTFEVQNMGNKAFENTSFWNASFPNGNEDYSCLWAKSTTVYFFQFVSINTHCTIFCEDQSGSNISIFSLFSDHCNFLTFFVERWWRWKSSTYKFSSSYFQTSSHGVDNFLTIKVMRFLIVRTNNLYTLLCVGQSGSNISIFFIFRPLCFTDFFCRMMMKKEKR